MLLSPFSLEVAMEKKQYINSPLTTEYMKKCLYKMHSDDNWRRYIKGLSTKQIHQLYKRSLERGQIEFITPPERENEQLDIWDVWGIKY